MLIAGLKTPGKPGRPVINALHGEKVTINWMPPDSDGGSRITQYVIHYSLGDVDLDLESYERPKVAGRSATCTYSKQLQFNKVYKFAVAAKNKSGIGPLSEFSETVKTPTRSGKNAIYNVCQLH